MTVVLRSRSLGVSVVSDPTRAALVCELNRLSTEAFGRLDENVVLPAVASLVAMTPLIGRLIAELVDEIGHENRLAELDVPVPGDGLYL